MEIPNETEMKYNCEVCNYKCIYPAHWKQHIESEKHKTGKRGTRCDKKYPDKCPKCEFIPKSNTNYLQHTLIYHSTKEERKEKFPFYCEACDSGAFTKQSFETHKTSKKTQVIK